MMFLRFALQIRRKNLFVYANVRIFYGNAAKILLRFNEVKGEHNFLFYQCFNSFLLNDAIIFLSIRNCLRKILSGKFNLDP